MTAPSLAPVNIQPIGEELAIAWNDGTETYLKFELLRRGCPCAACGGEPDLMGKVVRPQLSFGPKSFTLRDFRVIGGYALQPVWMDGHDTGLYTFPYLKRLGQEG